MMLFIALKILFAIVDLILVIYVNGIIFNIMFMIMDIVKIFVV